MKQKKVTIQYPDGQYHTIDIYKFYKVKIAGKDEYVIEYDDLTYNVRNCFSVLELENNVFVKKPLGSDEAYKDFYSMLLFAFKRNVDFSLLPDSINLCSKAKEFLQSADLSDSKIKISLEEIVICKDIGSNHDSFTYYLEGSTAENLGFVKNLEGHYHLNPSQLEMIKNEFEIIYKYVDLGRRATIDIYQDVSFYKNKFPYYIKASVARKLGLSNIVSGYYHLKLADLEHIKSLYNVEYKDVVLSLDVKTKKKIKVYEDISEYREYFPYYLDDATATALGLTNATGYYHLSSELLERLKSDFDIEFVSLVLNLGIDYYMVDRNNLEKERDIRSLLVIHDTSFAHENHPYYLERATAISIGKYTNSTFYHLSPAELDSLRAKYDVHVDGRRIAILDQSTSRNGEGKLVLTEDELAILDGFVNKLADFKDYYQFFGLEHLRNLPALEILNSQEVIDLTTLFNKGAAIGDVVAINLLSFMDEFKVSLKDSLSLK